MKKKSFLAACILTVGLLGGCGKKFDAAAYTKALLDTSYKNDSTEFISMNIGTTEDATDIYEQGLDAEVDAMLTAAGSMTDEQILEYRQVFADLLAGAKYTVSEAEKQDDGSYTVMITYEQMQIFAPTSEAYQASYTNLANHGFEAASTNGEALTTDEKKAVLVDLYIDCFTDALSNVTYTEPDTATIRIELVNDEYTPNESDLTNLKTVLFDSEANRNEPTFEIPFDAAAYTKALLDNSYKNDPSGMVSLNIGTVEEAADIYEQGLDAEVDAMLASVDNISEDQIQEFRQIFADLLAGAKYTVGEAEKQDDGSFVVTITYEQMQVLGPAMEQYMADVNAWAVEITASGNIPSEEEITEVIAGLLKNSFVDALPNATYAEPATTTIRIELKNNEYFPNENDLRTLETLLFDLDAV